MTQGGLRLFVWLLTPRLVQPFSALPNESKLPISSHPASSGSELQASRSSAYDFSRRSFLAGGSVVAAGECFRANPSEALAADDSTMLTTPFSQLISQPESLKLEAGLLESRVQSNVLNPPPYGMEGTDVFYPSWLIGNWKVRSETKDVQAPCGVALFGGNSTFNKAYSDIGNVLKYESRFLNDSSGRVIADREFNVKSIVKVAMGENSVVDVSIATPNKFSCLLAPNGSPTILAVDLFVLNRRQENIGQNNFDCSEVVREIAAPVDRPKPQQQQAEILKEIETTSLYTYHPEKDEVRCTQRSAAFLLPSSQSEMAMRMWQLTRGRAIDVRFYDVLYTRK